MKSKRLFYTIKYARFYIGSTTLLLRTVVIRYDNMSTGRHAGKKFLVILFFTPPRTIILMINQTNKRTGDDLKTPTSLNRGERLSSGGPSPATGCSTHISYAIIYYLSITIL